MRVPNAIEIDRRLREDFRQRVREYGQEADRPDPVLLPLFRTFAEEIAELHRNADATRLALLDEIMAGLGIEARLARPAQTIVRFDGLRADAVRAGTSLVGEADSGERLSFRTDATVMASPARLSFAFSYQDGALQLLSGVSMPDEIVAIRPSPDPVTVPLGRHAGLYLAIDSLPTSHLGLHGLFFDLTPGSGALQRALQSALWCLIDNSGGFGASGLLRPKRINAGVRALEWLIRPTLASPLREDEGDVLPAIPDGFYAGRVFVIPVVPPDRAFLSGAPIGMQPALERIFGQACHSVLSVPRAWLRIILPPEIGQHLRAAVNGIALNAVSASNLEQVNQTIVFERTRSVPVSREAGAKNFLVALCSISDERNREYVPLFHTRQDDRLGRYSLHSGSLVLTPAKDADGRDDKHSVVSIWATGGKAGNRVGANRTTTPANPYTLSGVRVSNPTAAAGGTDGEMMGHAQRRFAHALLSRDRIVTRADMSAAAQAFDPRIHSVETEVVLERSVWGIHRVQKVRLNISKDVFAAAEEVRIFEDELIVFLQRRLPFGTTVSLDLRWT